MQLYAKTERGRRVFAEHAKRGADFCCEECGGQLRVRGGANLRKHFYHLRRPENCQSDAKSLKHLQVQLFLQDCFGCDKTFLEHSFPEIRRIADVVCISQRLVIEVQCSAISLSEVKRRNADYESIGYEVLWVLHDDRYNGKIASEAELFLRKQGCYFTNIQSSGDGLIYDQLEMFYGKRRMRRGSLLAVDLAQRASMGFWINMPQVIRRRLQARSWFVKGDVVERWAAGDKEVCQQMDAFGKIEGFNRGIFWRLKRLYKALLQYALESCSATSAP